MLINCFSLLLIFVSIAVLIFMPKIRLPIHVDIIIFMVGLGSAALFVNTVLDSDLYGQFRNAEILFRFGFALLTMIFSFKCYKDAYSNEQ